MESCDARTVDYVVQYVAAVYFAKYMIFIISGKFVDLIRGRMRLARRQVTELEYVEHSVTNGRQLMGRFY